MPKFKLVTTSVAYLDIDMDNESEAEAWEDAIGEDGEIDTELLKDMLTDDLCHPYDNLDVTNDSQELEVKQLTEEESKALDTAQ